MNKLGFWTFTLSFAALACGEDSDEPAAPVGEQVVRANRLSPSSADALIDALGGQSTLDAIQGLRIEGSGTRHIINEGVRPADEPMAANTFERSVAIDFQTNALRLNTHRDIVYLFPGSQEYSDIIVGNVGASTQPIFGMPVGALGADKVASIRRQELLLTPHLLLREFTPAAFTAGEDVMLDGVAQHTLIASGGTAPLTLTIDASSGFITKLETLEHDFFQRDVSIEVFFADWAPAGDTSFPRSARVLVDGRELFSQQISDVTVNPTFEPNTFEFSEGAAPVFNPELYARGELSHQWYLMFDSFGLPTSGVDVSITPVDVAPNVLQLRGVTHHSFVVRQEAGLILVDAPQYDERSDALLDYLDTKYPGVPVTHVVASHFHADHVAGIREVLGRTQATLVVQESTAEFWRKILSAPSTLHPDALTQSPREVNMLTVPEFGQLTLEDASNPVTLYHQVTEHAADMLLTRDVASNSVFVVDIYSPGNPNPVGAAELDATLRSYEIPTAGLQIVGGHGSGIDGYSALQALLTPP